MQEINTSGQYGKRNNPTSAPSPTDPELIRVAEIRAAACANCEFMESVKPPTKIGKFTVSNVRCKKCGCAGKNLLTSKCPIGRHPE